MHIIISNPILWFIHYMIYFSSFEFRLIRKGDCLSKLVNMIRAVEKIKKNHI
jgi:hypothetical protein